MLGVFDRLLRLYVTRDLVSRILSPSYQNLGCDQMETKIGDTFKVNQGRLNDEVPVAEQWIPVPSPSATTPISPSRNDGKKTVTTPIMCVSNGSDNAAPNTFMLQPAQELKRVTSSGSEVSVVDKYNIGFSPVDIHGRVLLNLTKTGGWRAALFIFGTDLIFGESVQNKPEQHRNNYTGTVDLLIRKALKGHTRVSRNEKTPFLSHPNPANPSLFQTGREIDALWNKGFCLCVQVMRQQREWPSSAF